jgi:protoheme ferro-lyase
MKGVLLVNLGSPESPTAKDVKPYLDEFLMDKYVFIKSFIGSWNYFTNTSQKISRSLCSNLD